MLKKTNKKGFTLIELIIVVAIMAILVALLAPNVLKYIEKSKISKDKGALDAVHTGVKAEIMDEILSKLETDSDTSDGIAGMLLSDIYGYAFKENGDSKAEPTNNENGEQNWYKLAKRLFGDEMVLTGKFATNEIFTSKQAEAAVIKVYLDGKGGVAVAAVDSSGAVIIYDDEPLLVSSNFNDADLETLDCFPEEEEQQQQQ